MAEASLQVELREKTGHHTSKTLRREGRVPAIFYYHNDKTIPLSVDAKALQKLAQSEVNIIDLVFPDGKIRKSIFREIQRDPVTDMIIHLDIMGIKLTEKVKLSIPIILTGTAAGVKEGGILEHLLREVTVEGLPLDIPEHIEVDVSEMVIGDVDGDNFSEIVGLTYEGTVLVYQYDPLTVVLADGTQISWDAPHRRIDDTIWMSIAGFEALGCETIQDPDFLEISFGDHMVVYSMTDNLVKCGADVILPEVPDVILETEPYLPFFTSLECLGLVYTYDPSRNLVEVEEAG